MPKYQGKDVVVKGPLPMEDERHGGHPVENELVIISDEIDNPREKIVFATEITEDAPPV